MVLSPLAVAILTISAQTSCAMRVMNRQGRLQLSSRSPCSALEVTSDSKDTSVELKLSGSNFSIQSMRRTHDSVDSHVEGETVNSFFGPWGIFWNWGLWNSVEVEIDGTNVSISVGRELGEGTYGMVRLLHTPQGALYAGKIVPPEKQHEVEDEVLMQKECQDHDNIVKIVSSTVLADEGLLIVTEFLPDGDLHEKIKANVGLQSDYDTQATFGQLVDAVKHMHQSGVVHRDLKPENIFCSEDNTTSRRTVKIGDFGYASSFLPRALHPMLDKAVGSATYASPEIWRASKNNPYHGPEVDVWSLGIILYLMLSGHFPWTGVTVGREQWNILNTDYPPLRSCHLKVFPCVSDEAQELVANMLDKDSQTRYTIQTVAAHPAMKLGHIMKVRKAKELDQNKHQQVSREVELQEAEVELQTDCQANEHIVKIVNKTESASGHWLCVLEHLPSGSLIDKFVNGRLQPNYDAHATFQQLVDGVKHMHLINIAHGDLKPENIFCDDSTSPPTVKIGAFGLAARIEPGRPVTRFTEARGTPAYASPELWRASKKTPYYGPGADVWSLGVILYMMLSGRQPWQGASNKEIEENILNKAYNRLPSCDQTLPCISEEAQELVANMLEKDSTKRFSMEQVAAHRAMTSHPWKKYKDSWIVRRLHRIYFGHRRKNLTRIAS